jgi:hypothetical protein
MALPDPIRVKLSSEAAEYVSLTPVVVQDMPLLDVLERIVASTGKDLERVRDILRRGAIVSGASRLRWPSLECDPDELAACLAQLPGDEPARPFAPDHCTRVVLIGMSTRVEIPRQAAAQRRFLQRRSFWEEVLRLPSATPVTYAGYFYRDRVDRYRIESAASHRKAIRDAAGLLRFPQLSRQILAASFDTIEFHTERPKK